MSTMSTDEPPIAPLIRPTSSELAARLSEAAGYAIEQREKNRMRIRGLHDARAAMDAAAQEQARELLLMALDCS